MLFLGALSVKAYLQAWLTVLIDTVLLDTLNSSWRPGESQHICTLAVLSNRAREQALEGDIV